MPLLCQVVCLLWCCCSSHLLPHRSAPRTGSRTSQGCVLHPFGAQEPVFLYLTHLSLLFVLIRRVPVRVEVESEIQSPLKCLFPDLRYSSRCRVRTSCRGFQRERQETSEAVPPWGWFRGGQLPQGPTHTNPVVLLKEVVLYKKKQSFTGNSSFQREGKIQRDVLM